MIPSVSVANRLAAGSAGFIPGLTGCTSHNEVRKEQEDSTMASVTNEEIMAAWEKSVGALCPTSGIADSTPLTNLTAEFARIILEKNPKAKTLNPYEKQYAIAALKVEMDKTLAGKTYDNIESTHWTFCATNGIYGRPFLAKLDLGIKKQAVTNLIDNTKLAIKKHFAKKGEEETVKLEHLESITNGGNRPVNYTITLSPASFENNIVPLPSHAPDKGEGSYKVHLRAGRSITVENLNAQIPDATNGKVQITAGITVFSYSQTCLPTPPEMIIAYQQADGSEYEVTRFGLEIGSDFILRKAGEEVKPPVVVIQQAQTPVQPTINYEKNCEDSGGEWLASENNCKCPPEKPRKNSKGTCYKPSGGGGPRPIKASFQGMTAVAEKNDFLAQYSKAKGYNSSCAKQGPKWNCTATKK